MKRSQLFLILLLSFPLTGFGQEKAAQSGCTILKHHIYIQLVSGKLMRTDSVEMLITDRRGEKHTTFGFQYSKGDKFTIDYAQVTDLSGNVVRTLKKRDIKEHNYSVDNVTLYSDEYIKYFDLRHNVYPYKISFACTHILPRFLRVVNVLPTDDCDIVHGRVTVDAAPSLKLKYKSRNMAEPAIGIAGKYQRYVWDYSYEYQKSEVYSSEKATHPFLNVVTEDFKYGVTGSHASWESFGRWAWELNDGLSELPPQEKAKIDALLEGAENDREKVKRLYHYLQDYNRYINVKLGIGGFKSFPAEYVCTNRFGDCKALSNYMRAILKYAGIEGYYTLAYLDPKLPVFNEDFPANVFNHIITVVPVQNDTIYLECTSKDFPFGYTGSSNQGRKALLTKYEGSHLIDIPAMRPEDVECNYLFTIDCPDERKSTVKLSANLKGPEFETFSGLSSTVGKNDVEMLLRNGFFDNSMVMTCYNIGRPHRDSTFVTVDAEFTDPGFYRRYGDMAALDHIAIRIPGFESPEKRRTAVQIDIPFERKLTTEYNLDVLEVVSIPIDTDIISPYGRYSLRFEFLDTGIRIEKHLLINAGEIPLENYPAFYDFISGVRDLESTKYQISVK